jgi:hypothetical protein
MYGQEACGFCGMARPEQFAAQFSPTPLSPELENRAARRMRD